MTKKRKTPPEPPAHEKTNIQSEPRGIVLKPDSRRGPSFRKLAASPNGDFLCVAYGSGRFEIWETEDWTCLETIEGQKERRITSLFWWVHPNAVHHVLATTLEGELLDIVLDTLKVRVIETIDGGGIWDMKIDPATSEYLRFVLACDDGVLRLYQFNPDQLFLVGTLRSASNRALCVDWSKDGKEIVAGYADSCFRKWTLLSQLNSNLTIGREVFCCTLPLTNPETDRPSIRSILHLQSEIVCGDTSGNVHFWDAQFGSQLNAFQKHEADVTQLRCIDRRYLIASGSDATVTIYHKEDSESDWKYVHLRRPHVHDVQDLLFFVKDRFQALMTASRDGLVRFATCGRNEDVVQSFLKQRLEPLTLLPENPRFRLRPQPFRNVLAVHAFHVDLWKLPADPVPSFATSLDEKRSAEPSLLFRLQSTGGQGLTAAALSPDGRFCVLSTRSCSKWIRIEDLEKQPRFQNVSSTNNVPSALDLHFSMDSKWLFLLDFENRMSVVDTERRKTLHQWKLQTPENERPFLLHPKHLTFSKDDSHFVYHIDGNVFLYLRNGESPRNGFRLLHTFRDSVPITALCFGSEGWKSIDAENVVRHHDLEKGTSKTLQPTLPSRCHSIVALSLGIAIAHSNGSLLFKPSNGSQSDHPNAENVRTLFLGEMEEPTILSIEANWNQVLQKLPPPIYRHRYGT